MNQILLDTRTLIWFIEGTKLKNDELQIIDSAIENNHLNISSISIWEIAMLVKKNKIALSSQLYEWVHKVQSIPGLNTINLSANILLESCNLPNHEFADPADRMIIATCRAYNLKLITYDTNIINYAERGYLKLAETATI